MSPGGPESLMADHDAHDYSHDEQLHAPAGNGKYVAVFLSLCILTAMSFMIGNSEAIMSTPSVGWTGMLAVSCAKAMLVILFFMHLKWEANWKYVLTIPASMMSVFLLVMLVPDIGWRTYKYSRQRWLHASPPAAVESVEPADEQHGKGGGDHVE